MSSEQELKIDVLTVAAMGVVMYIAANIIHEAAGHLGACIMVGGVPLELSSAHADCDLGAVTDGGRRFIAAWAAILNLLTGLIAWGVSRSMKNLSPTARYALWLFMTVSLMVGTGYPLFSGVIGIGDYAVVIEGWEPAWLWRAGNILLGLALYAFTIWFSLREMSRFIGAGGADRVRRSGRANLIAYLAGSFLASIGSIFNPIGAFVMATSAAAHFGGTSGLAWMNQLYKRWFPEQEAPQPFAIPLQPAWIVVAAILLAIHIVILGPTITF